MESCGWLVLWKNILWCLFIPLSPAISCKQWLSNGLLHLLSDFEASLPIRSTFFCSCWSIGRIKICFRWWIQAPRKKTKKQKPTKLIFGITVAWEYDTHEASSTGPPLTSSLAVSYCDYRTRKWILNFFSFTFLIAVISAKLKALNIRVALGAFSLNWWFPWPSLTSAGVHQRGWSPWKELWFCWQVTVNTWHVYKLTFSNCCSIKSQIACQFFLRRKVKGS